MLTSNGYACYVNLWRLLQQISCIAQPHYTVYIVSRNRITIRSSYYKCINDEWNNHKTAILFHFPSKYQWSIWVVYICTETTSKWSGSVALQMFPSCIFHVNNRACRSLRVEFLCFGQADTFSTHWWFKIQFTFLAGAWQEKYVNCARMLASRSPICKLNNLTGRSRLKSRHCGKICQFCFIWMLMWMTESRHPYSYNST